MSETTMPAAEAQVMTDDREVVSYELAFHVLPTVAEGEVATVLESIKQHITQAGGTLGLEEVPKRFDLAYEITKMIEGKYRRFTTAHFGWVRFTATPDTVAALMIEVEEIESVLRAMLIKLTKQEEAHPFNFHDAVSTKRVRTIDAEPAPKVESDSSDDDASEDDDEDTDTDTDTDADTDTKDKETPTA